VHFTVPMSSAKQIRLHFPVTGGSPSVFMQSGVDEAISWFINGDQQRRKIDRVDCAGLMNVTRTRVATLDNRSRNNLICFAVCGLKEGRGQREV